MNENLNLVEILKDCPKGTKLYSIIYGEVEFNRIEKERTFSIIFVTKEGNESTVTSDGKHYKGYDGDCTLFPSKDQRDWSKFTAPWLKKQGKPKPYSGVSFKHIGHIWDMRARDGGVEIFVDGEIKVRVFLNNKPRGKSALEAIKEEKVDNANKVEPEFKVGDWITFCGSNPFKILKIEADINGVLEYLLLDQNGHDFYFSKAHVDKNVRLWTIQDAKDGDVLATSAGAFIYNGNNCGGSYPGSYCGINNLGNFQTGVEYHWTRKKVYPATKEQRDLLFQKMKEAGYEWDADKKELKKLVPNRFDPKTLQPYDKVLVRDCDAYMWKPTFLSYINNAIIYPYVCGYSTYRYCIPYNDDTKHLAGTKDEAPEYYRYWED